MKLRSALPLAALLAATAGVAVAVVAPKDEVGPKSHIQPSGRLLLPPGKLTALGNHPGGGALTHNARFLWTLSAGRGRNDIRIVEVAPPIHCSKTDQKCKARKAARVGRMVQKIQMPGVTGGIVMAKDGRTAYVSGVAETEHEDQQSPKGTPGKQGDVIHVFKYDPKTGRATRAGLLPVPPPSSATAPQNFPPTNVDQRLSWPRDLAISRDGRTLLAALNLGDAAAIVDTKTKAVRYVQTGDYPYGAAITRDGRGLISNEADGTVSVIDLKAGTKLKDIKVGAHLSHPESIAADPTADRAFVAVASEDRVAVVNTKSMTLDRQLELGRRAGRGTEPTHVAVDPYGCYLTSADSGEDAAALYKLRAPCRIKKQKDGRTITVSGRKLPNPRLLGRIPTASYPVMATPAPHIKRVVWIAAKGFGVGSNPNGPNPLSPNNSDDNINTFRYLPAIVTGTSGVLPFPTERQMKQFSDQVTRQIRPVNSRTAPPGSPLVPPDAPGGGKIKHVFYIVRENRTYDQIFGDLVRGEGAAKLSLFPENITPNAHALARRFPLLDHVFANSEASIDGHFWTSASAVSDYVVKNWHQNYGHRGRPYDFGVYSITWPAKRFVFDQAEREGISYFNYGEAIAGTVPLADKDRNPTETQQVTRKFQKSDLGPPVGCFPNDAYVGENAITQNEAWDSTPPPGAPPNSESRFDCFKQRFQTQLATNSVPALNYLVYTSDHTQGLSPGRRTPRAMVAENDYALGQTVDLISHSSIWKNSMILVIEDDSQDGADHVDAHRIPAFAISPYAKQGAVVQTRYDFPSFMRTAELPIGMNPINLFDALGVPLYDAFQSKPDNIAPYSVIPPKIDINARNADTPRNRRAMKGLNSATIDKIPQHQLDNIVWWSVHGFGSKPPPSGPNADDRDAIDPDDAAEGEGAVDPDG
ncbi:MAG TPA: alkaline phosphatase family protein [Thermoleophilaceae bacterium]|nr:alkaline phosphatase family protein [Thermoleophilaceae bacterium]